MRVFRGLWVMVLGLLACPGIFVSKIRGTFFGGPYNKDYSRSGSRETIMSLDTQLTVCTKFGG